MLLEVIGSLVVLYVTNLVITIRVQAKHQATLSGKSLPENTISAHS